MAASQIWLGSLLLVNQPAFSQIYLTQIEFDTYSKENRFDDHEKVKIILPMCMKLQAIH
jgi:hypothetical protein